jgi:hypothetical protein
VDAFDAEDWSFFSSLKLLRDRSSFLNYLVPLREAEWLVQSRLYGELLGPWNSMAIFAARANERPLLGSTAIAILGQYAGQG